MSASGPVVCFGELLFRLTPPGAQLLVQADSLELVPGGAEANVAVAQSRPLGVPIPTAPSAAPIPVATPLPPPPAMPASGPGCFDALPHHHHFHHHR